MILIPKKKAYEKDAVVLETCQDLPHVRYYLEGLYGKFANTPFVWHKNRDFGILKSMIQDSSAAMIMAAAERWFDPDYAFARDRAWNIMFFREQYNGLKSEKSVQRRAAAIQTDLDRGTTPTTPLTLNEQLAKMHRYPEPPPTPMTPAEMLAETDPGWLAITANTKRRNVEEPAGEKTTTIAKQTPAYAQAKT